METPPGSDEGLIERLKPCPFCGGEAETEIVFIAEEVRCSHCKATGPVLPAVQDVYGYNARDFNPRDGWNTRAESQSELLEATEDVAAAMHGYWQGPNGRSWERACADLPGSADWFRRLAQVALRSAIVRAEGRAKGKPDGP